MTLSVVIVSVIFGVAIMRRRSLHTRHSGRERAQAYEEFLDVVLVALQSGVSLAETLRIAADCSASIAAPGLRSLVVRLDRGEPIRVVLNDLANVFGARCFPLVDIVRSSLVDGMPVLHIVERLADETRAERRRQLNEDLKRLPIRLVFPLVFCVLPSFVILTIFPIALRAITAVTQGGTP